MAEYVIESPKESKIFRINFIKRATGWGYSFWKIEFFSSVKIEVEVKYDFLKHGFPENALKLYGVDV